MELLAILILASPPDLLGMGAIAQGQGGCGVNSRGSEALYYNPAALSVPSHGWVGAVFQYGAFSSPLGTKHISIPLYLQMGTAKGAAWGPVRITAGIVASLPSGPMAQVQFHERRDPFYPYYDNRTQRAFTSVGLSVAWGRWSVGVAVDTFASLQGRIIVQEGPDRAIHQRTAQEMEGATAPIFGFHYEGDSFGFGIAYRQGLPIHVEDGALISVVSSDMDISIRGDALPSPPTLTYGITYRYSRNEFMVQVDEVLWSYVIPYIELDSQLPLLGALTGAEKKVLDNTWVLRLGYARAIGTRMVRAGFAYEPSFVPPQIGETNLMDGDKLTVSVGLSTPAWTSTLHIFASLQYLIPRRDTKKVFRGGPGETPPAGVLVDEVPDSEDLPETQGFQTSNPGYPVLESSGFLFLTGMAVEVRR